MYISTESYHLVPDNVVKNSEFYQFAISKGWYSIDRASNGKYLAYSADDFVDGVSSGLPVHRGPHSNYDNIIKNHIRDVLESRGIPDPKTFDFTSLDDAENVIKGMIDEIEELSLIELQKWGPAHLK